MTITIDKGVPVPSKRGSIKYPFASMEIGDSFFAADKKLTHLYNAISSARLTGLINGQKYTLRTEANGVRVWRTQ